MDLFQEPECRTLVGPDMLSALSLMHESSGSFPFLIKKRTRQRKKECRQRGRTEVAVFSSFSKRNPVFAGCAEVRSSALEINERCSARWHFRAHAKVKTSC